MAWDFSRDDANDVVVDNRTNLMWQDEAYTNEEATAYSNETENGKVLNWANAITYCEDLTLATHSDWRLPNKNELKSIVDTSETNPAMSAVFQNRVSSYYWSSTIYAGDSTHAWDVNFDDGYDFIYNKTSTNYVRCVR